MDDLMKSYSDTDFKVYTPEITIKVGSINLELDKLLLNNSCVEWAYITAWNPYSEITERKINDEKNNQLKEDLSNHIIYDGEGVGTDPTWEPEKSFLILGISKQAAILIGKKYGQNAIVVGEIHQVAELLWIR